MRRGFNEPGAEGWIARLEGCVALETLVDRLRNLRFTAGKNDLTHNPMFIARGLRKLHLEFDG